MKRLLLILFCLGASAQADALMRLDSLRYAVLQQLNAPVAGDNTYSTAYVNRAINRAVDRVSHDFPAVEKWDTVVTESGTRFYPANSDFIRLHSCHKASGDTLMLPLQYEPVESLYDIRGGVQGANSGAGDDLSLPRYAWAFGKRISFYPVPKASDTMFVTYYAVGKALLADTTQSDIATEYRDAVVWYACYALSKQAGRDAEPYLGAYKEMVALNVVSKPKGVQK